MSRPCDELKEEISTIKKNIEQVKKDLNNPKYQDTENQKNLLFRLKGNRKQLVEVFNNSLNCGLNSVADGCDTLKYAIMEISKINIFEIKDNEEELTKYFEKEDAMNRKLKDFLRSIVSMEDYEQQLATIELCFHKFSKPDDESCFEKYVKIIISLMKELRVICLFNITQNENDVFSWKELEKEISFFLKHYDA